MAPKEKSTITINEVAATYREPANEFYIHASSDNPDDVLYFQVSYLKVRTVAGKPYMSTIAVTPNPREMQSQKMETSTAENKSGRFIMDAPEGTDAIEVRVVNRNGAVATQMFTTEKMKEMEWDKPHSPETEAALNEPNVDVRRYGDFLVVELQNLSQKDHLGLTHIYAVDKNNAMTFLQRNQSTNEWLGSINDLNHIGSIDIKIVTDTANPFYGKVVTLELTQESTTPEPVLANPQPQS